MTPPTCCLSIRAAWLLLAFCWSLAPAWAGFDVAVFGELPVGFGEGDGRILDRGNGPGHGIAFFQYTNRSHVGAGNHLRAGLNTETVWIAWDLGAGTTRPFVFSPYLKGQFGFAEMTPDYIAAGRFREELSFLSMYGELGFEWRWRLLSSLFVGGSAAFRYWFFLHRGEVSRQAGLLLPADSPALLGSLALGWEGMRDRARGRLKQGYRARLTGQLHRRMVQRSWGGLSVAEADRRNATPVAWPALQLTAFLEAAWLPHPKIGIWADLMAGISSPTDDLHRFKIGGDNDYVPMLSGTYFAEFVVDAYLLSHIRAQFLPLRWLRITAQLDLALIQDPLRRGRPDESRWITGLGLALDFFVRDYHRIHLKVGFAPQAPRPGGDGGYKLMLGYVGSWGW